MPTARKLPSGSWRCQVYSHTEEIRTERRDHVKKKRIYKSFTSNIPGPKGKREAERLAADFAAEKESHQNILNCTLGEAIDDYIASKDSVLSPSTIADYKKKRKNSFKMLMDVPLTKSDEGNAPGSC